MEFEEYVNGDYRSFRAKKDGISSSYFQVEKIGKGKWSAYIAVCLKMPEQNGMDNFYRDTILETCYREIEARTYGSAAKKAKAMVEKRTKELVEERAKEEEAHLESIEKRIGILKEYGRSI